MFQTICFHLPRRFTSQMNQAEVTNFITVSLLSHNVILFSPPIVIDLIAPLYTEICQCYLKKGNQFHHDSFSLFVRSLFSALINKYI